MEHDLKKEIETILTKYGIVGPKVVFTTSTSSNFGDYSTNVAMIYAKQLDRIPLDLANEIKEEITSKKISNIAKIDIVSPGFINFFFGANFFAENVSQILKNGPAFTKSFGEAKRKFFIEHTQPNPFKEFHIGHLMNNTIGESISRIVKANGAEVKTCSYHGDVGLHVAKTVWGIFKQTGNFITAYARGHKAYEEDEKAKEEIIEINKKIYDHADNRINLLYEEGRKTSLDNFELLYKKLDSHFDYHFFESQSGEIGKKLVLENVGKVFERGNEGAVIFRGENFEPKTHTRVFLNKEGLPTYEAKELGLAKIKKDLWKYDESITITANEQDSFFDVVEVAIGEVFPELKGRLLHISHGMLKLPSGKMSSRTGNIISAEALIDQVKAKVLAKMNSQEEMSKTVFDNGQISEIIAIGAIKYSILRQAIGGDIVFDFDKSISFEGDSGPYLQYATVRANSLLQKAQMSRTRLDMSSRVLDIKVLEGWQTTNLEKLLENFPGVVERAGMEYAPHHIVTYLIELSGEFNSFYANHKIIDEKDSTSPYRITLTAAFAKVMTSGLNLLGIKVPDKM